MKYYLETYRGSVEIDLPEGTTEVAGIVLSGDEVLVYPVYCDPMYFERVDSFIDGPFRKRWNGEIWEAVEIPEINVDINKL